ncbi:MAG: tRNA (adenosine(37)-N6)-threonylcarbamoyltransferase complex ATPase subunit type 1 TsaE [Candidatus Ryanbacteria bacterium RIFCSPLOWO2_01_FULL_48_26]|uniref:tRNA threonylcarbamoyladenosine biosynthesis protein TsaE n=1 Tax=Candidatus Ryanbacteria bacterium RIFCSPLOWO2_01_FULL_48_26 TaxID=1802126 RepID=A0A1G2GRE3_9BACT|nr:MAG: tRNA (adenosine(37)-N6)-threonylcarbamoyltransferase complex ATPase subunit type 1 TsaE [Candidatus Ryanbacteria bacterium RIFCSPLOWO2_01_FULL_48_26]
MAERILAVIPVKTGIQSKKSKTEGAFIIALSGDLGAGKTTFVQGFARGLGIKKRATSPTFIIFRRFAIPKVESHKSKVESLYHVDAYRIKKSADLTALGFKEILKDPKNIVLIEWPENIKKILPKTVFWVRFKHGRRELERSLTFSKDLL